MLCYVYQSILFTSVGLLSNDFKIAGKPSSLIDIFVDGGFIPDLVIVEPEKVQVDHLVDARRHSDQLVVIQTQFHHGVV